MWFKQSVKDRVDLMKSYRKAYPDFSYDEMVKHFNDGLEQYPQGGKLPKSDANNYYTSNINDPRIKMYNDSLSNNITYLKNIDQADIDSDKMDFTIKGNQQPSSVTKVQGNSGKWNNLNEFQEPSQVVHYMKSSPSNPPANGIGFKRMISSIPKEQPKVIDNPESNVISIGPPDIPVKPKGGYGSNYHPTWSGVTGTTDYWYDNPKGERIFMNEEAWTKKKLGK